MEKHELVARSAQSAAKPTNRWRSLVAMAFAFIVDSSEGGLINSLFPVIRGALGLNLTSLGVFQPLAGLPV